jgi:hypothetical protein
MVTENNGTSIPRILNESAPLLAYFVSKREASNVAVSKMNTPEDGRNTVFIVFG